jgi:hypothetical protein
VEPGDEPGFTVAGGLMFHQRIAALGLSIEEGTDNVPQDGRFYVLTGGRIDRAYRTLREATRRYESLKTAAAVPSAE